MEKNRMENRYKIGDIVCAKVRPSVMLVVRLYVRRIYYCAIQNDPTANELVYFNREFSSDALKNIHSFKAIINTAHTGSSLIY